MFSRLKRMFNNESSMQITSPLSGKVCPLSDVNDPTFSQEILGKGCAIQPAEGKIVAPVDAIVSMMFDTGHAVSLETSDGIELLIHVGLDTVMLKGQHFTPHCATGDKVKAGDTLLTFDTAAIQAAGYDTIVPVIVCNVDDFKEISTDMIGSTVHALEPLLTLKK